MPQSKDFMRRFILSAGCLGVIWAMAALTLAAAAEWLEHACGMPARANCGGCAVSCPAEAFAVCRSGLSIWRGARWSCSYPPVCACQRSLWQIWP